jgi:hypothetical protein
MNYSLPDKQLALSLSLIGVALDKMKQGVTLERVYEGRYSPGVRLRADGAPLSNAAQPAAKTAMKL